MFIIFWKLPKLTFLVIFVLMLTVMIEINPDFVFKCMSSVQCNSGIMDALLQ
jgi:hypothetical protein